MTTPISSRPAAVAPSSEQTPRNVESLSSIPKKRNSSLACLACRGRKSKCNSGPPCDACVKFNTECVIDETSDLRRRIHLLRKLEEAERHRDSLNRVFTALRDGDNDGALRLLDSIRSRTPLDDIVKHLDSAQETGDVEGSSGDSPRSKDARRILDMEQFLNIRAFPVPAKPWTTVTDDNDFVSHLISLWFTWFQPCFNWIDRDMFMRDMSSGNMNSKYCSPLLVNAILAHACLYSNLENAFQKPSDITTRGSHFYEEAKRLLEESDGAADLPTLHGLCSLSVCAFLFGDERGGWSYLDRLAYLVQEYSRARARPASESSETAIAYDKVDSHTVWGIYNIATALAYQRVPLVQRPVYKLPPADHANMTDSWYPYPSLSEGLDGHTRCLFNSHCELAKINADLCRSLFDNEPPSSRSATKRMIESVQSQLQDWYNNLPDCLAVTQDRPLPQFLTLHMYYYSSLIAIFTHEQDAQGKGKGKHRQTEHRDVAFSSAREISRLVGMQRSAWGVQLLPSLSMEFVTSALFALLDDLDDPNSREAYSSLFGMVTAASQRWKRGKDMVGALQLASEQKGVTVSTEV